MVDELAKQTADEIVTECVKVAKEGAFPVDMAAIIARRFAGLEAERDRLQVQIRKHEEAEASVCPEDVGFVEFIGSLTKDVDALTVLLARAREERDRLEAEAGALRQSIAECDCENPGRFPRDNDGLCASEDCWRCMTLANTAAGTALLERLQEAERQAGAFQQQAEAAKLRAGELEAMLRDTEGLATEIVANIGACLNALRPCAPEVSGMTCEDAEDSLA